VEKQTIFRNRNKLLSRILDGVSNYCFAKIGRTQSSFAFHFCNTASAIYNRSVASASQNNCA